MAYFFHLLHRFLSDSYMVSLCPDLLEQHSTVSQYIPTSAAHLLTEKKRDYFSSVLKNWAPCYTAHSVLIIYKAFYNKGRFYFTDLHFQTPTCSFHSSDVNFFPVHPMPRLKTQNCYKCFQHFNVAEDVYSQSASRSGVLLCTSTNVPFSLTGQHSHHISVLYQTTHTSSSELQHVFTLLSSVLTDKDI